MLEHEVRKKNEPESLINHLVRSRAISPAASWLRTFQDRHPKVRRRVHPVAFQAPPLAICSQLGLGWPGVGDGSIDVDDLAVDDSALLVFLTTNYSRHKNLHHLDTALPRCQLGRPQTSWQQSRITELHCRTAGIALHRHLAAGNGNDSKPLVSAN